MIELEKKNSTFLSLRVVIITTISFVMMNWKEKPSSKLCDCAWKIVWLYIQYIQE